MGRRVQLDDVFAQVRIADPQWSPDGSAVLIAEVHTDRSANARPSALVQIDADTGARTTWVTALPGVTHGRWLPDGGGIALLAPHDGAMQIHRCAAPGAVPTLVTSAPHGVRSFACHPAGDGFAYAAAADRGPASHNRAFVVGQHSALTQAPPRPVHLWHRDRSGATRRFTADEAGLNVIAAIPGGAAAAAWSPDGASLTWLSQAAPGAGILALRLHTAVLATGAQSVLLAGETALASPRWSPDGTALAVLAPAGEVPLFSPKAAFVVRDGALHRVSAAIDRDLTGLAWLPSGALLLWAPDGTRVGVWVQPLDGPPRALDLGDVDPFGAPIAVGPQGQLAFVGVTPHRPSELYVMDPGDRPRRVTDVNAAVAACDLGAVETVRWTGTDGTEQDGVLVVPPDFDPARRYPLLVSLHGGPMGASGRGWTGMWQVYAAQGWLVFSPNYRGSNHRGAAFQESVLGDPAVGPAADIQAGVAALSARGIVDGTRRATTGWSYGGYLAAWLAATSSGWVAAVAGAPVIDWRDQRALSDLGPWFDHAIGGTPTDHGAAYDAASPLSFLADYATPTLILACTGDDRVPITNAYRLFRALQDRGTEVSFVAYPVAEHMPSDPVHQHDLFGRILGWLRRHLVNP